MSDAQRAAEAKVKASAYNGGSDPYASYNYNTPERRRYEEDKKMKSGRKAEDVRAIFGGRDGAKREEGDAYGNTQEQREADAWDKMNAAVAGNRTFDITTINDEAIIKVVQDLLGMDKTGRWSDDMRRNLEDALTTEQDSFDVMNFQFNQKNLQSLIAHKKDLDKMDIFPDGTDDALEKGIDVIDVVKDGLGPIGLWAWIPKILNELMTPEEYKKDEW